MDICSDCYQASYAECSDFLVEVSIADGTYWAWIYDKFGNVYKQTIVVASGAFTLYLNAFPEGLFTASAGGFTLSISTSSSKDTNEAFAVGYTDYTCAIFDFYIDASGTSTISPSCGKNNYTATTDPTVNDDNAHGYSNGGVNCTASQWKNTATKGFFVCDDDTNGAANWINFAGG